MKVPVLVLAGHCLNRCFHQLNVVVFWKTPPDVVHDVEFVSLIQLALPIIYIGLHFIIN